MRGHIFLQAYYTFLTWSTLFSMTFKDGSPDVHPIATITMININMWVMVRCYDVVGQLRSPVVRVL